MNLGDGHGKLVKGCLKFEQVLCLLILLLSFSTQDRMGTHFSNTEDLNFDRKLNSTKEQGTPAIVAWYALEAGGRY